MARIRGRQPGDEADDSGRLQSAMLVSGNALGFTLALLATFLGIGVLVNVVIFYVVAQVLAERKQNQEANRGSQ